MTVLSSARDLTIPGHTEDAERQLHRAIEAGDQVALAAWATHWGESAIAAARSVAVLEDDDKEERVELESERKNLNAVVEKVEDKIRAHLRKLDKFTEGPAAEAFDALEAALSDIQDLAA